MTKKSSDLIDRQLARYRQMRDFQATAEPPGGDRTSAAKVKAIAGEKAGSAFPFVVQKHAATRLHYDFRLGLHGVLKSWAIAKGPSFVTADKRLAVEVEDHPMEYGGFEGAIPKGQYGGGTVMLWDEGRWEPEGDPDEGLRKGTLKFILYGKKLRGKWVLVRMGGRAARESKPNWLLIKEHDEFERTADDRAITEEAPNSVATKRSLEAIARDEDHVWESNRPEKTSARKPAPNQRTTARKTSRPIPAASRFIPPNALPGKREKLPGFLSPQLARQASQAPQGDEWIHELKLDGYRIQAHIQHSKRVDAAARLFTRNGLDWTHRMPEIASELERLKIDKAILDGEVVVLTESGETSFAALQAAFDENRPSPLTYFVFDLLHLNGHTLRDQPLIERKQLLASLVETLPPDGSMRLSEHVEGNGSQTFAEACKLGAEGIVSKRSAAAYTAGRSASWIKVKCIRQQEFVIGGFTLPSNGSRGIGALLLGYYEDRRLQYAGRTGTGFSQSFSRKLRERLEPLQRAKPAFAEVPPAARRGAIWTEPKLVAEVRFSTWTADHLVRQASFKGIREDKAAEEVRREEPDPGLVPKPADENRRKPGADPAGGKPPAIRVTHPDKVIDPETGLTKQALVDYYLAIAEWMLPHVAGRPLALVRCPDGVAHHCFFQKHWERGMPSGVDAVAVANKNGKGSESYVTLSTAEALAGLAQMNVLEIHPWGSTNANLDAPDRLIFDLDPDAAVSWRTLADAAREVRERLERVGLKSFLKTTGGKGLHIVAPLRPEHDWSVIKAFAQAFALEMESENGQLYISKMTKAARKNKIFVDYMRNERGATAVAPYSSRARPGLTAALPLRWTELKTAERPRFPIADFAGWKKRLRRDPWEGMAKLDQRLRVERDALRASRGR